MGWVEVRILELIGKIQKWRENVRALGEATDTLHVRVKRALCGTGVEE